MEPKNASRLAVLALVVTSVGCASVPGSPPARGTFDTREFDTREDGREPRTWRDPYVGVEAFWESHELDEIEFDDDLDKIFGDGIRAVERDRVGVRVSAGIEVVRAYVQVFGEDLDDFDGDDLVANTALELDDMIGIGVGARGDLSLLDTGASSPLLVHYRAGLNFVRGEGNFRDANPGTLLASADEDGDFFYVEQELEGGVGLDIHGLRPTIGVYASFLGGLVEDDIVADDTNDDLRFRAFNSGLFVELRYEAPKSPLRIGVRGTAGDVEGVEVFLGFVR